VAGKKPAQPPPGTNRPPASATKTLLELSAEFLKQCATATATVAMAMGCTGAQLRPEPAACPQEALKFMFGLDADEGGVLLDAGVGPPISIDKNRRWKDSSEPVVFTDGYIESYVERGSPFFPTGTILKGQLWTGTGALVGRYHEAHLPDGRDVPVCMVLGTTSRNQGLPQPGQEGSKPGAVVFQRDAFGFAVERYP
jgi:serine/threonine-protein kinase